MNALINMENDLPFAEGEVKTQPLTEAEVVQMYFEPCKKCGGRGMFFSYTGRPVGPCFTCKGKGKMGFKTAPEQRERARATADARKERQQGEAWEGFAAEHAEIAAWILSSKEGFEFAASLEAAVLKWGKLTDGQLAAAQKCINARKASQEARKAAIDAAPEVTLETVEKAFQNALDAGVRRPKLNLDVFTFSLAPATGRNAGAVYVKEGEQYLGKVMGGKFLRTRDCSDEQQATIQQVAADPKAAAIAYGKRFGSCSICRRELTNEASINLGIGPICAEKFGW